MSRYIIIFLAGLLLTAAFLAMALLRPTLSPMDPNHPDAPEPWSVTPSLYPSGPGHAPGEVGAELVQLKNGEVWFDARLLGKGEGAVGAEALKNTDKHTVLRLRSPLLSPDRLMRWLQAIRDAGYEGVKLNVLGARRGDPSIARHDRGFEFATQGERGWVKLTLGPRKALVTGEGFEPIETRNGVALFAALMEVGRVADRAPEDCVEVVVEAPIETEHLLNAMAIASGVPRSVELPQPPSDREALADALLEPAETHCATLALPVTTR